MADGHEDKVGNWYKNITTLGPAQAELAAVLSRHARRAFLTPTRDMVTVVFDERSDGEADPNELGDLALTLSLELNCPALAAAVYDDDVLLLALYVAGKQLGEFNSAGPSTLSARSLAGAFGASRRTPLLWLLLRSPRLPLFLFESFRHRLLLLTLGQPDWAFATGYKYIRKGEPPEDLEIADMMHIDGVQGHGGES